MAGARSIERKRPRRSLRRLLVIAGGVLAVAAVGGVAFLVFHDDAVPLINSGPNPRTPVVAFTAAWVAGDYHAMYRQLSPQSRAATTYRAFRRAYGQAATVSTLKSLQGDRAGCDGGRRGHGADGASHPRVRAAGGRAAGAGGAGGQPLPGQLDAGAGVAGPAAGRAAREHRQSARPPWSDPVHQPDGAGPRPGRRSAIPAGSALLHADRVRAGAADGGPAQAARSAGLAGQLHVRPGRPRAVAEPGAGRRPVDHAAGAERHRYAV